MSSVPGPSVTPVDQKPGGPSHSRTPDDEDSRSDEAIYPSAVLANERRRQSFMATVLNPTNGPPRRRDEKTLNQQIPVWEPPPDAGLPSCFDPPKERLPDPIELNLLSEQEAMWLLDKYVCPHLTR